MISFLKKKTCNYLNDGGADAERLLLAHAEQRVPVRPGARAPGPGLNAK
jgi:hypothetical protein